jgi:hypothetical protein
MGASHTALSKHGMILKSFSAQEDNNLESRSIVWLDDSINNSEEYFHAQQKLRTVINHFQTFKDIHKCKKYIKSVSKEDRIILIVNNQSGEEIITRIHQLRQITSIYVYNKDQPKNKTWTDKFTKVNVEKRSDRRTIVSLSF